VIEVADASLAFDKGQKLTAYAAEGIAEYWIVDVIRRQIEVHRHPESDAQGASYVTHWVADANSELPVTLDGSEIGQLRVHDLLP
jgi:Uma2 family endonuclease